MKLWKGILLLLLLLAFSSFPVTSQCCTCYCAWLGPDSGYHCVYDGVPQVSECVLFQLGNQWVCRWGGRCGGAGGGGGGGGGCVNPNGCDCDDWLCNLYY